MEFQVGDSIEYKGKPGKVAKVGKEGGQKVGIQLDDPSDKDQPKGDVMKTGVKLLKTSVPAAAVTPRNRSARAGGGAAIGMAIGAMVGGVVGASVGAVLGGALVGSYSDLSYRDLQKEAKERQLSATGKADKIRQRLEDADAGKTGSPTPAAAAAVSPPATEVKGKAKAETKPDAASPRGTEVKSKAKAETKPDAASPPATEVKGKAKAETKPDAAGSRPAVAKGKSLEAKLNKAAAVCVMPALMRVPTKDMKEEGEMTHAEAVEAKELKVDAGGATLAGPLFGETGPQPGEVHQGDVGDCYLAASLTLLAGYAPEALVKAVQQVPGAKGKRAFKVTFATFNRKKPGPPQKPSDSVTVVVDDTFYVNKDAKEPLYMGTADGVGSVKGAIWPCIFEKAWAVFIAKSGGVAASYDLVQAVPENPFQARCTIDEVCAALGGWGYDSTDNPTDKQMQALHAHVLEGQPAALGTGELTEAQEKELKLYSDHQYAVMGISEAADGEECFDVRNPHNKMKTGKGVKKEMIKPHRAKTTPSSMLYWSEKTESCMVTAEFLLPLNDASSVLQRKGSSIIFLTMPET